MGGNTPSKVEQEAKPVTTVTNVLGTVTLFIPGLQGLGIALLVSSKVAVGTVQLIEGEDEAGFTNLALAGITAAPGLGSLSEFFGAGRAASLAYTEVGQAVSIVGNAAVGGVRAAESWERGDTRGTVLNAVQAGVGSISGFSAFSGGSTDAIEGASVVANAIYATDATCQVVKGIVQDEDVDWCDLVNNTCNLVGSTKMMHDSSIKLRGLTPKDSLDFDCKNPPGKLIKKNGPHGEEVWKLDNGNHFKKNLAKHRIQNFLEAEKLGIGVPIVKANVNKGFIEMETGMSLGTAKEMKLITDQEIKNQLILTHKILNDNKLAHCDVKCDNIRYFPDQKKILCIDNGDIKNFNDFRDVWTQCNATTGTKLGIRRLVGSHTDKKGLRDVAEKVEANSESLKTR